LALTQIAQDYTGHTFGVPYYPWYKYWDGY
jgi:hypothetical protein